MLEMEEKRLSWAWLGNCGLSREVLPMLDLLLLAMCCILMCSEEFTMICAVLVEMEVS